MDLNELFNEFHAKPESLYKFIENINDERKEFIEKKYEKLKQRVANVTTPEEFIELGFYFDKFEDLVNPDNYLEGRKYFKYQILPVCSS